MTGSTRRMRWRAWGAAAAIAVAAVVGAVAGAPAANAAEPTGTLDQSSNPVDPFAGYGFTPGSTAWYQTFTSGRTGELTAVQFY